LNLLQLKYAMTNFYHGQDEEKLYWINLDNVSFAIAEENKLILKMIDGDTIAVDDNDVKEVTKILFDKTLNFYEQEIDDKRYNHEDGPTKEEIETSKNEFTSEDWQPKELSSDDDDFYCPY